MSTQNPENHRQPLFAYDEVSIIDLLLALKRRWKLLVGVVIACMLLAVVYIYSKTDVYRYTLEIEVGQLPQEPPPNGVRFVVVPPEYIPPPLIEKVKKVVERVEVAWIPEVLQGIERTDLLPPIRVSGDEDTRIVQLTSVAPLEREDLIQDVMEQIGAKVVAKHAATLEAILKSKQKELGRLKDRRISAEKRLDLLLERQRSLRQSVDRLDDSALAAAVELHALFSEQNRLERNLEDVEAQIARKQEESDILQAAVQTFRPDKLDAENLEAQDRAAASLETVLEIEPTRALNLPTPTAREVGVSDNVIMALALALGIGAGIVIALTAEGLSRRRG